MSDGWNCDIIHQDDIPANTNFQFGSSTPVNMYEPNDLGFSDAYGNAWEWCEDHFNGLPGTLTSAFYDDFSTPCYDGRHNLILVSKRQRYSDCFFIFSLQKMLHYIGLVGLYTTKDGDLHFDGIICAFYLKFGVIGHILIPSQLYSKRPLGLFHNYSK